MSTVAPKPLTKKRANEIVTDILNVLKSPFDKKNTDQLASQIQLVGRIADAAGISTEVLNEILAKKKLPTV